MFVVTLLSKDIGLAQQSRGARPAAPWAPLRFTSSPCGWAPWQVWFQPRPICWTWTRWSDKWRGRSPSSSIYPMAVTAELVAKANPEMPQTGNSSQSCSASPQGPSPSLSCSFSIHLFIWCHVLLKPSLKELEPYLASMWSEHNYIAVWTFFAITLLWDYHASIIFLNVNSISGPISKSQNVNILWMFVDNLLRKPGNPYNEVIKGRK